MTNVPFKYKLKHWWYYLSPRRRKHLRTLNEMVKLWWGTGGEAEVLRASKAAILQGIGYAKIDWEDSGND